MKVAVTPALGIASFATLLTTASLLGVPLGATSIPLVVAAFVVPVAVGSTALEAVRRDRTASSRRELLTLLALAGIVGFALASSWDIAYPFQPRGTDWGHYLLYAEEVAAQGHLLIDDPLAGEDERVFADPPAVGAAYGSVLLLDGISSWSLTIGLVVVSALSVLSVYAAAAVLWGTGAGLVAAGAYAVAPIRLDPMYWHGLGTALAMLFVPLVILALGLLFRGERGWRHVLFLSVGLVGVAAAHSTSAVVVAAVLVAAPLVDVVARLVRDRRDPRGALRDWWSDGIVRPLLYAAVTTCVLGAGVVGHLWLQGRALGRPVSYRFLGPDWLDRASLEGYYGLPFLVVSLVAVVLVLTSRRLRRDPALLAVASLAIACVVVGQLWRAHVSFDYQRVVYYFGVGLALLIGAAFTRRKPHAAWVAAFVLVFVLVARSSVGLRLPERVVESEPRAPAVSGLTSFREKLDTRRTAGFGANRHGRVSPLRRAVPGAPADASRVHGTAGRLRRPAPARAAGCRGAGGRAGGSCAGGAPRRGLRRRRPGLRARSRDEARRDDGRRERGPGRHSAAAGALRLTPRACRSRAAGARSAERRASAADGRAGARAGAR